MTSCWEASPSSALRCFKAASHPADRDPYSDRHQPDRLRDGSGLQLNSLRAGMEAERDALLRGSNRSTAIVDSEVGDTLARDMIEVHGTEAATIARDNARAAALAAQIRRRRPGSGYSGLSSASDRPGTRSPVARHSAPALPS